jgi:hypothetical protein
MLDTIAVQAQISTSVRTLQAVELDCIAAIKVGRGQLLHLPQNAVGEQCQALRRLDG